MCTAGNLTSACICQQQPCTSFSSFSSFNKQHMQPITLTKILQNSPLSAPAQQNSQTHQSSPPDSNVQDSRSGNRGHPSSAQSKVQNGIARFLLAPTARTKMGNDGSVTLTRPTKTTHSRLKLGLLFHLRVHQSLSLPLVYLIPPWPTSTTGFCNACNLAQLHLTAQNLVRRRCSN